MHVQRTYLQLLRSADLRGSAPPLGDGITLRREHPCTVATYRALYAEVGTDYHWRDRDAWSDETLGAHLAQPGVEVWVLRDGAAIAGYVELAQDTDGSVEIAYVGLVAAFHGRGLGGWLLTKAAERGWKMGANRVWLHTCTLDGSAALPNYLARGFVPYRTEAYDVES